MAAPSHWVGHGLAHADLFASARLVHPVEKTDSPCLGCYLIGVSEVTQILQSIDSGDPKAAEELLPSVYDELRRLAASKMAHESPGQTLQATALVHEAWVKLAGEHHSWESRHHFMRAAAEAMRRILVDRARRRLSQKRAGDLVRVPLENLDQAMEADDDVVVHLNEALEELASEHPEKAELVKLRFFVGLRIPQAAECLGISPATAKRFWMFSRAWLLNRLTQ